MKRVYLLDCSTGQERLTYHIECVGPAYLAGWPFLYQVELGDTDEADSPPTDDACAFCGGLVKDAPR